MRTIEYQCGRCEKRQVVVQSVHDPEQAPWCCKQVTQWAPTSVPLGHFTYNPSKKGRDTGVYEYDYGVRATWDLTVPGKIDRLEHQGRIPRDPFKETPNKYAHKNETL